MTWFNDRRSAVLAALAAVLAVILPAVQGEPTSTVLVALGALAAAGVAYVAAYQAIGLTEKLLLTAAVAALTSVTSGLNAGLGAAEIAVTTGLVLLGQLGAQSAAPSTAGSAAGQWVEGTVIAVEHDASEPRPPLH